VHAADPTRTCAVDKLPIGVFRRSSGTRNGELAARRWTSRGVNGQRFGERVLCVHDAAAPPWP